MPFIPVDKMSKLREASKQGDERAKKILKAYMSKQDYASDLDAYFNPAPVAEPKQAAGSAVDASNLDTGNEKLNQFLRDNGITSKDAEDYQDAVNDYYNEFPNERPEQEPEQDANPGYNPAQEPANDMAKDMAQGIIDLISKCDNFSLELIQNDDIDDTAKKGAMISLQEIKQSLFDAAEKLKKIKNSFAKKEQEQIPVE